MKYNQQPVIVKGQYYPSQTAAGLAIGKDQSYIFYGIHGKKAPHKRNPKPGWRYATDEEIERYSK